MEPCLSRLNQTPVKVRQVRWVQLSIPCDRCSRPARRAWETSRTAIDIDLDQPVLLQVTVSVHHCRACQHYFRAQPPFLRPDATYTNRVVAKAVASVFRDGMAFTRVAQRLARDFWVRPSERMVRLWCRAYTDDLDLAGAWPVTISSGSRRSSRASSASMRSIKVASRSCSRSIRRRRAVTAWSGIS